MKTLKITTDSKISIIDLNFDHESLREEVGGYVELVRTQKLLDYFKTKVVMIVDEEGLVKNLPVNPMGCYFYDTGLMASKYRSQDINSYKSIRGIFKKVSMWLLVVVGAIIDELLLYAATTIGKPVPVTFLIACIVAMWLICNEIISILENIQDMGVNIPAFLQPLVKHIRSQVEERINIDEKDSEDE